MTPPSDSPFSLVPIDDKRAPGAASPAAESMIDWPLPPFQDEPGENPPTFENATVIYRDGRRQTGRLMRFSPTAGLAEFCPERAAHASVLALADLLELRLTRPIRLRARRNKLEGKPDDASQPSSRQPFRLGLTNGTDVQGETLGFQVHAIGLFLYLAGNGDTVTRILYPTAAIREKQIGKRLGELLVDNKSLSTETLATALDAQTAKRSQKLGEILTEGHVVAQDVLLAALERQRNQPVMRLGEALIAQGIIQPGQLEEALERQKTERGKPLGELLVEMGALTRADLVRALTQKLGIPYVDLTKFRIDPQVIELVPRAVAAEYNIVPLCRDGKTLVIAVENPLDPKPIDRIRFLAATTVTAVMASAQDIRESIKRCYATGSVAWDAPVESIAAELSTAIPFERAPEADDERDAPRENDTALVRLVNKTIADARDAGASDIHVECNDPKKPLRIRFRQDGALREYLELPASYRKSLVSRIKIMASLDISEKRKGQDGKIRIVQEGVDPLELRVATIPTLDGREDVVLRVLSSGKPLPLARIGLRPQVFAEVDRLANKPYGIFIVCGPTGSGKSTTLHSILGHINQPDRKIWTAEDPVEIQQEGLRQVQVNAKTGWTFAAAMRSFLRADPDVIMVGEMRDEETAQIAIEASLTGHTVFSTLHTNSAVDSVLRLLDMGVQPFNFADSLLGVLAQRLVRRLCDKCKTSAPMEASRAETLAVEYCAGTTLQPHATLNAWEAANGPLQAWHAPGCEHCRNTGYRGRAGIHELFVNTPRVTPLIHGRDDAQALRAAAFADGMRTLKQDGIEKVLQGVTDIKEVRASCA